MRLGLSFPWENSFNFCLPINNLKSFNIVKLLVEKARETSGFRENIPIPSRTRTGFLIISDRRRWEIVSWEKTEMAIEL